MKKTIILAVLSLGLMSFNALPKKFIYKVNSINIISEKLDIKIKNDTSEEVKVINAGSGGSYSLTKNATTTIKMEEGDKLHYYDKGKKGDLILVASKEMHNKVQLMSKLR